MVDDGMIDKMKTLYPTKIPHTLYEGGASIMKPEDYWSCIAHLGAEDFSNQQLLRKRSLKILNLIELDQGQSMNLTFGTHKASCTHFS